MKADRYSCQISLNDFGQKAQDKLRQSKVLIVGMGGLGCPASLYLTSMGIGTLGVADFDTVSRGNLHRQILYSEQDVGKPKVNASYRVLKLQNPEVNIKAYAKKINSYNATDIIKDYDIVLDCTDNFETRYLLNDACVLTGKPLVYGAIFQYEGQVAIWNLENNGRRSINYRDIFPNIKDEEVPNCSDGGVIPTIAGITGCVQATETVKYLVGLAGLIKNKLFIFDAKTLTSYTVNLPKNTTATISELSKSDTTLVEEISHADLSKLNGGSYLLIDVRSAEEHRTHNIGGRNIPMEDIDKSMSDLPKNKKIIFYCASGVRSMVVAKKLANNHFYKNIVSLKGGVNSL